MFPDGMISSKKKQTQTPEMKLNYLFAVTLDVAQRHATSPFILKSKIFRQFGIQSINNNQENQGNKTVNNRHVASRDYK
jgi:hypothetical protein